MAKKGGGRRSEGEHKGKRMAAYRTTYKKCLAPGPDCANKVSGRAHSIQNTRVVKLLADHGYVEGRRVKKGHVIMPETRPEVFKKAFEALPKDPDSDRRIDGLPPFRPIGRNQATTFTGLCGRHDSAMFVPIEGENRLTFTEEQKFLLAYREVLREFHTSKQAALVAAEVALADRTSGRTHEAEAEFSDRLAGRMEEHAEGRLAGYKKFYDEIHLRAQNDPEAFRGVVHYLARLPVADPKLAASSTFYASVKDPRAGVVLTVFPYEGSHMVLISYLERDSWFGRRAFGEILRSLGDERLRVVTKLILLHCENFVIAPSWWESLGDRQRKVIEAYAYMAAVSPRWAHAIDTDPDINLFGAVR